MASRPPARSARARRRAQVRRRRRAFLAACLTVLATTAIVFSVTRGPSDVHGNQRHRALRASTSPPAAGINGPRSTVLPSALNRLDAREAAEVKRLIGLGLPVFCGGLHGNEVAFTFDDGPGVYTHYAIKKLTQAHERATFFVVGRLISLWPGWLPRELKLGSIGDHTWTHPELTELPPSQIRSQLNMTAGAIHAASGEDVDAGALPTSCTRRDHRSDCSEARPAGDPMERRLGRFGGRELGVDHPRGRGRAQARNDRPVPRKPWTDDPRPNHAPTRAAPSPPASVSVPELLATDPPSLHQLREGLNGCDTGGKQLQLPIPGLVGVSGG